MERGFDALREQIVRRLQQTGEELLGLVEEHRQEVLEQEAPSTPTDSAPTDAGLRPLRAAIASLDGADSQAEILARLLEVSSSFASRSALLLKTDDGLKVWSSTGFDESHEGQQLGSFDDGRWVEACSGRGATRLDSRGCAHLAQALEADLPSQGAVVPLVLRDEVPAVLYADTDNGSAPNLEALQLLTYTAAQCLETLPLRSERPVSTLVALEQDVEAEAEAPEEALEEQSAEASDSSSDDSSGWGGAAALGAAAVGAAAAAGALTSDSEDADEAEEEASIEAADPDSEGAELDAAQEPEAEPTELEPTDFEEKALEDSDESVEDTLEADSPVDSEEALDAGAAEATEAEVATEEQEEVAALEAEPDANEDTDEPSFEAAEAQDPGFSAETRAVPTMDLPDADDASSEEASPEEVSPESGDEPASEGPSVFGIAQKAGAAAGAAALAAGSRLWGGRDEEPSSQDDSEAAADEPTVEEPAVEEPAVEEPAVGDPLSTLQTEAPPEPAGRSVYDEMGALDASDAPSVDPVSSLETQVIRTGDLPAGPAEPVAPRVFGPPPPVTPPPADDAPAAPEVPAPPAASEASASTTNQVMPPEDVHEGPGWAFTGSASEEPAGASATEGPLHEEARRLARLLVSEIKLYNEEQIEEGRRQGNIYEQLKDDIDRSKRMYEERIDQTVRQSTDYFRDELVRSLADGDAQVLGL